MKVKALLLAGGLGERLRPLTATVPKCLVPIGGKPLLDYWVEALVAAGIHEAVINTHHLAEQVRSRIERINTESTLRVTESHEPHLLGSAGTLTRHRNLADDADAILVVYTDNLSDVSLRQFVSFHGSHELGASLLLFRAPCPAACGIVALDSEHTVVSFVEKPRSPSSNLASAGLYLFRPELFRRVADFGAFDLGADVLPKLVGRMKGQVHDGYHLDIGTPQALARANADVASLRLPAA